MARLRPHQTYGIPVTATTETPSAPPARLQLDDSRFTTSWATLFFDRFMTWFIKVGGALVILAVFTIFLFIGWQVLPLFGSASVAELRTIQLPPGDYLDLASDEHGISPFAVARSGALVRVDTAETGRAAVTSALPMGSATAVGSARYDAVNNQLALGLDDGRFLVLTVKWGDAADAIATETLYDFPLGTEPKPIRDLAFRDSGNAKIAAAIVDLGDGTLGVRAMTLEQKVVLGRRGKVSSGIEADLSGQIEGVPAKVLVDDAAESVVVATVAGDIFYFFFVDGAFELRQRFRPFKAGPEGAIASIDYLNGGVSLVLTDAAGDNAIWSLYQHEDGGKRLFGEINRLDALPRGASAFDASTRTKAFLLGAGTTASLRYATTGTVRWEGTLPAPLVHGAINGKNDRLLLLDDQDALHVMTLDDPHPEAGFRSFFGKLWYEGSSEPSYQWQSTGGTDQFEPKLSLIPLIIGTLKGTFYALLFAFPIALLAAIYTSEFMNPAFKLYVKPVMELMSSLPSVVLGFIAALWLAPTLETQVPTVVAAILLVPLAAVGFGWGWTRMPIDIRTRLKPGIEFIVFLPILVVAVWLATLVGPLAESLICGVTDVATGKTVADFRLWWPTVTDTPFEQRNSLVVGFVMGFAVIPIIFTISEDSLSSVPPTLRSASLALGASRWQTAIRVIVPTASAGIFSAVMIGLGRAVGETMIVVMATGNTPIMDMNIFTGMRTLSANIAVELPEAPHHSTLFRALFLGAMVLFLMTFAVNTVAEVIRQRLREKYKTV